MTSPRYRVVALHGFFGAAADWDVLREELPDAQLDAIDVWQVFSDSRVANWEAIGAAIDAELRAVLANGSLPAFLVGYSLGARLLLSVPGIGTGGPPVAGTCLVSCHPGLPDNDDGARAERKAADEAWARKIVDAPLQQIWKDWDAQPVFTGSAVPRREPRLPAPRVTLARTMRVASLATQPDRRPLLRAWRQPLLWVTGERDPKFEKLAVSVAEEGIRATFVSLEHAGHRVPWDNPFAFARALSVWVDHVLKH